jgi:hypothetical protein
MTDVHNTVAMVSVISGMGIVIVAVQGDGMGKNVNTAVTKNVLGTLVGRVMAYVLVVVLVSIMELDASTRVVLTAIQKVVTDITVHVQDVGTDISVRIAGTPVVQTALGEHVINRRENVREDVKQTGPGTCVTVSIEAKTSIIERLWTRTSVTVSLGIGTNVTVSSGTGTS